MIRPETVGTPARRFSEVERDEIRRRLAAGERHKDWVFRRIPAADSGANRLLIPIDSGL